MGYFGTLWMTVNKEKVKCMPVGVNVELFNTSPYRVLTSAGIVESILKYLSIHANFADINNVECNISISKHTT